MRKYHGKTPAAVGGHPLLCGVHHLRPHALPAHVPTWRIWRGRISQAARLQAPMTSGWQQLTAHVRSWTRASSPASSSWLKSQMHRGDVRRQLEVYRARHPEVQRAVIWVSLHRWALSRSWFWSFIIAVPLGIVAATKQYSVTDYTVTTVALAGYVAADVLLRDAPEAASSRSSSAGSTSVGLTGT